MKRILSLVVSYSNIFVFPIQILSSGIGSDQNAKSFLCRYIDKLFNISFDIFQYFHNFSNNFWIKEGTLLLVFFLIFEHFLIKTILVLYKIRIGIENIIKQKSNI